MSMEIEIEKIKSCLNVTFLNVSNISKIQKKKKKKKINNYECNT